MTEDNGSEQPKDSQALKNSRRLTLGHIADELGISTATVSLALRDSPLVADDTKIKVKETARAIGYIYNRSAASLRTARSQIVGVAVHDILNPYFAEMFSALEDELEEHGQMVFICNHRDNVERQQAFVSTLLQHRADGLILCPSVDTSAEEINQLIDQGLPVTLVAREIQGVQAPCVRGDDLEGAYQITKHLIDQGHTSIAMVGGRRESSTGKFRNAGWRKALEEAGIDPNSQLDLPELMTQADGRSAAPLILEAQKRPTAIVAFNDLVAFGLMTTLRRAGVEPGPDIAITGYDDIDGADARTPSLTTVYVQPAEIGRLAAKKLLHQIEGEEVPNTLSVVAPELKIRESAPRHGERLAPRL